MDYIKNNYHRLRKVKLTTSYEYITWRFTDTQEIYMYVSSKNNATIRIIEKEEFLQGLEDIFPEVLKFSVAVKHIEP